MNTPAPVNVKQGEAVPVRSPFGMFGSLQREIDRLFDDFAPGFAAPLGRSFADVKCRMDLAETKDGLELSVELPGLEEKDVEVSVADGVLTVSGEKKFETEHKDKTYGYNAQTGEFVDLVKAGVIDPTKVTRTALQNAASIASLMLTTEAMIAEIPEKKPAPAGPGGHGPEMDY